MRRTPMRRSRLTRTSRRRTGPDKATTDALWARAGDRCEGCGWLMARTDPHSKHHRLPRGMGGTRDPRTNRLSNLLLLCGSATSPGGCHEVAESQRAHAVALGWVVPRGHNPAAVPARVGTFNKYVLLTDDGHYFPAPAVAS